MLFASETFTLDEMDDLEDAAQAVGQEHLESARIYLCDLMMRRNVEAAIMGGYALWLRGSRRETTDIDMHCRVSMRQLRDIIRGEKRIISPNFMTADVVKTFVRCGGGWDNLSGREQVVEVDLFPDGAGLARSKAQFDPIQVGSHTVFVYDVRSAMTAKFRAYHDRMEEKDIIDLIFLIEKYETDIREMREDIKYDQRHFFIDGLVEFTDNNRETVARFRQVLAVDEESSE